METILCEGYLWEVYMEGINTYDNLTLNYIAKDLPDLLSHLNKDAHSRIISTKNTGIKVKYKKNYISSTFTIRENTSSGGV